MLKGAVTATNAQGENGNSKIATVESKTPINTEAYGDQTIQAKVTYIDGSEQDVTIPLKVKMLRIQQFKHQQNIQTGE